MKSDWLLLVILLALIGGGAWYYYSRLEQPTETSTHEQAEPGSVESTGPSHPMPPALPLRSESGDLVDLPPLDDSDSYFALALVDLLGPDINNLLVSEALIEKFVTTVDNLTRGHVTDRIRPLRPVAGSFLANAGDDRGFTLSPENFGRYAPLVEMLTTADVEMIVEIYRRYYPLMQQAYESLGYPDGYFNDRAVEVIDHLLETPEVEFPIRLVRPHVFYEYADPDLESLSSGQKLLLRIGPDNSLRIKQLLRELRSRIAAS